jgi:hypothetical protein
VRLERGRVWLDLSPPDPQEQRRAVLAALPKALADVDHQRLVRETARLVRIGADPADAVRAAIAWSAERMEFGTSHALAGAPDWMRLHDDPAVDDDARLAAIGEILGHIADDVRGTACFPFAAGSAPWDEQAFLTAVEQEHEADAVALLRGALRQGLTVDDVLPALVTAALAHYADFGHSLIYTVQTAALIRRLGPEIAEAVLAMLARSLIYASREDLLPEFRLYATLLHTWGSSVADAARAVLPLAAVSLRGCSAKTAMQIVACWGAVHPPEAIFPVLVEANAWILLHVDERLLTRTDAKLADNINWLDFTHALTFGNAGREAAALRPALWPAVLLQLACFIGRNAAYVDAGLDVSGFAVTDVPAFLAARRGALFDHGRDRFIISVHLLKTLSAGEALIAALPEQAPVLVAALNRFLSARMKGRHVLRTARQMSALAAQE